VNIAALGRYQILRELGRGSMGVVYGAHDPVIDRPVAIKTVILPESISAAERETFLNRFFHEARAAGKLIHSNIVVTYDAAVDEPTGTPFIAMELIDGGSLAERLAREGRIPWESALDWVVSLARALDYAHQEGIVHRDIKPANVIFTRRGVPKIADFGIAKLSSANLTQTGVILGTPCFMSPEQLRGEALDGRSDLFSLAALFYSLVVGRRPFEGEELAAIASQVLYKDPLPASEAVSGLPPSLDGVLARALMKSADARYASGEELAEDLLAVKRGVAPGRAVSTCDRTQAGAVLVQESPSSLSIDLPGSAARSSARLETDRTIRSDRAFGLVDPVRRRLRHRLSSSSRWRRGAIAFGVLLFLLTAAFVFRENLGQWKLYLEARKAADTGKLELSERKLEEILHRNPGFASASDFLLRVSAELVLPELPIELAAKHDHRIGSCTGQLTLRDGAIEYRSKSHGSWHWPFAQVRSIEGRGSWGLTLQTYEDDLLGLRGSKNYNFSLQGGPLAETSSKRYERLLRYRRLEPTAVD